MPEFPEVTVVRKSLQNLIENKKIIKVEVVKDKFIKNATEEEFKKFLTGKKIINIDNIGKFIVFSFDDNSRMISHLRMEGKYYIRDLKVVENRYYKHDYIYFFLDDNSVLAYNDTRMFGSFEIIPKEDQRPLEEIKNLAKLPREVDVEELHKKLQKRNKSIKSILLDQSLVLGIGNIYADEALFASKIYPMQKCNTISLEKLKELLTNAHEIMDTSLKLGGSSVRTYASVNGTSGSYQDLLKVYGKADQICSRCKKAAIVKVKLDFKPNGRGTSYCPNCQKEQND